MNRTLPEQNKGFLVVISGPSGGGKGTVVKRIREKMPEVALSVSATTRAPREGETDGKDYYFIDRDAFEEMVAHEEVLEYTTYTGNYYGTPKKEAERILGNGSILILEIEVDGAAQVRRQFPDAVTIMLLPPSLAEQRRRLEGRATENAETIEKRLTRAKEEVKLARTYDYVVFNHTVEECADEICSILRAEMAKTDRRAAQIAAFIDQA